MNPITTGHTYVEIFGEEKAAAIKAKLRAAALAKPLSAEARQRLSEHAKLHLVPLCSRKTAEQKQHHSEVMKVLWQNPEYRNKTRAAMKGKRLGYRHSVATRQKMSQSNIHHREGCQDRSCKMCTPRVRGTKLEISLQLILEDLCWPATIIPSSGLADIRLISISLLTVKPVKQMVLAGTVIHSAMKNGITILGNTTASALLVSLKLG